MSSEYSLAVAAATCRILAGILFFSQGYDKVFNIGIKEVGQTMRQNTGLLKVPESMVFFSAALTSWLELLGGFLLIIGLYTITSASLLCADLIIVTAGLSIARPMWETGHVMIRLILLIFILVIPVTWDIFSLDYLFGLKP
jgi:putative oxidoreductase